MRHKRHKKHKRHKRQKRSKVDSFLKTFLCLLCFLCLFVVCGSHFVEKVDHVRLVFRNDHDFLGKFFVCGEESGKTVFLR